MIGELTVAEVLAEIRRTGDWSRFIEQIPYARFVGLSVAMSDDALVAKLSYADMLVGNPALPALHGGTIGALLESAAIFELLYREDITVLPKTINLTIDYMRSAGPRDTFASAAVTRRGRRVANVTARAWQDDPEHPVAAATCHFLVM